MNFFEHQAKAHQYSRWLILLFIAAVIVIVGMTDVLVTYLYLLGEKNQDVASNLKVHLITIASVLIVMMTAIVYRMNSLDNGGVQVARELGARLIPFGTRDPKERQLLNVVEEMAIASGFPVPQTYIIDTKNLNAFAAGYTTHDAVVAVTDGLLQTLSRDELQGVIAHEFSHIANGDMRLNLKLTGTLFGILFIALTGQKLLSAASNTRRDGGMYLMVFGFGLMVIGYVGLFFSNIIKASISRQREFLADASAVQFTRNTAGIRQALLKINASVYGSALPSDQAAEFSHFFFLEGIASPDLALFDTHPTLDERIKRLKPNGDNELASKTVAQPVTPPKKQATKPKVDPTISMFAVIETIMMAGMASKDHINYAQQLIHEMPSALRLASQSPLSAYAMIIGLMMHESLLKNTAAQDQLLPDLNPAIMRALRKILQPLLSLNIQYRLPLIAMALPTLKSLSEQQKAALNQDLLTIIHEDDIVEVWEWALHYWITQLALNKPVMPKPKYDDFSEIAEEATLLISAVAYASSNAMSETAQRLVFKAAERELGITIGIVNRPALNSDRLVKALENLRYLQPLLKANFLKSLALVAQQDGIVEAKEVELIRTIAEGIGCPIPPVLPETSL